MLEAFVIYWAVCLGIAIGCGLSDYFDHGNRPWADWDYWVILAIAPLSVPAAILVVIAEGRPRD